MMMMMMNGEGVDVLVVYQVRNSTHQIH